MSDEKQNYPSRTADQFVVRFPDGMRDRLKEAAATNGRSMNAEIIARLSESLAPSMPAALLEAENKHLKQRIEDVSLLAEMEGTLASMMAVTTKVGIESLPSEWHEHESIISLSRLAQSILARERRNPGDYKSKEGEREVLDAAKLMTDQVQEFMKTLQKEA